MMSLRTTPPKRKAVPTMIDCKLGFRLVGPPTGARRRINWRKAFDAYCRLQVTGGSDHECYLSAFSYADDFAAHLAEHGTTGGYDGVCGAGWLWWDIDRDDDLDAAHDDAVRLSAYLADAYAIEPHQQLVFFSGVKGFHVGMPLGGFNPAPGTDFHRVARHFAEHVAADAEITIDTGVYDKVRAFRAPNSRHPKSGLYKRRLTAEQLHELDIDAIRKLAEHPEAFEPPTDAACAPDLPAAWNEADAEVERLDREQAERKRDIASGKATARVNRQTLAFIQDPPGKGDRHRLLFSAAANLAECGAPYDLVHDLLSESALDSGLPPADVERQIRCGCEHATELPPPARDVLATFPETEVIGVRREGGAA